MGLLYHNHSGLSITHSFSAGLFYCLYISCLQPETSRILCIYHPTECPSCSCWHHDVTTTVQVRSWLTRPRSGSGDNHGVMSGELMHKCLFCRENIYVIKYIIEKYIIEKWAGIGLSMNLFNVHFSVHILVILLKSTTFTELYCLDRKSTNVRKFGNFATLISVSASAPRIEEAGTII